MLVTILRVYREIQNRKRTRKRRWWIYIQLFKEDVNTVAIPSKFLSVSPALQQ